MGFKVNLKEVNNNLTALTKSVKQLDTRLDASKNALNKIVTSNSIYGATGKAITNDINNNQSATLVGFEDMTTELIQEYEDLIQEFQSTVGETDSSAVMNEDALNKFKQDLTSLLTDRSSIDSTFQQAYNLANSTGQVSLSMPKSSFNSDVNEVTKDVADVINKVQAFNSRKVTSQSEALLDKLTKQIHSFAGYGSTSFSNAKLQTFMAAGSFASNIETADKDLTNEAKKEETQELENLTKEWETEYPINNWNKMTQAQKLQYSSEFSEYLSENGIKMSAKSVLASIGKTNDSTGFEVDYKSLVKEMFEATTSPETVGKALREAGNVKIVKGLRMGALTGSEEDLSRMASRGSALKSAGEDLVDAGDFLAKSKVLKVAGAAGAIFGAGVDYENQMAKYHDQGRAIKNTIAHAAIGEGGTIIGGIIGTAIPIPVVGTLLGAAAGAAIGWVGDTAYDWVESGQAGKDLSKVGKQVSKTVDNVKNEATKVLSGFGKSLGSVFG